LFTFENGVSLMRQGASVVEHHLLPLMNRFNKTEAAVFSCSLCFRRAFPFINLIFFLLFLVHIISLVCIHILSYFAFIFFYLFCIHNFVLFYMHILYLFFIVITYVGMQCILEQHITINVNIYFIQNT